MTEARTRSPDPSGSGAPRPKKGAPAADAEAPAPGVDGGASAEPDSAAGAARGRAAEAAPEPSDQTAPPGGAEHDPASDATLAAMRAAIRMAPNRITLAEGIAVEWKSVEVPAGPGGVEADVVLEDGQPCLLVRTPDDSGWIRLACDLPRPEGMAVVGLRALVRLEAADEEPTGLLPTLRPTLATTVSRTLNRTGQPDSAVTLTPAERGWLSLHGLFVCAPAAEGQQIDLMINLPPRAVLRIAALDSRWFAAELPEALTARLAAQPILPLVPFFAAPLDEPLARVLARPAIYAAAAQATEAGLSGWLFSEAPPQVVANDGAAPVAAEAPVLLPHGVVARAGFALPQPARAGRRPEGAAEAVRLALPDGGRLPLAPAISPRQALPMQPRGPDPLAPLPEGAGFLARIEALGFDRIEGWIKRLDAGGDAGPDAVPETVPEGDGETPVDICVLVDGLPCAVVAADAPKSGPRRDGWGEGAMGFAVTLPDELRDGQPHLVEVIENATGLALPGGRALLRAGVEGVAFADLARGGIAGWVSGQGVRLRIDGGEELLLEPDRLVPGFEPGNRKGFLYPLPIALRDGRWHRAELRFGGSDVELDGSPVAFRFEQAAAVVRVLSATGRRVLVRIADEADRGIDIPVGVIVDGRRLSGGRSAESRLMPGPVAAEAPAPERAAGCFSFAYPAGAREITLVNEAHAPPVPIARFRVDAGAVPSPEATGGLRLESGFTLDAADCARASAAFRALGAEGEEPEDLAARFDALWYLNAYPEAAQAVATGSQPDAVAHYVQIGAGAGLSPNPWFDEAAVRAGFPEVAAAIAEGRLPCAFAVVRALGSDPFQALPAEQAAAFAGFALPGVGLMQSVHLRRHEVAAWLDRQADRAALPEPEEPPQLPPPAAERDPADCIYAAWLSRLGMDEATRRALARDEAGARRRVTAQALERSPLVSVIMPSFNRAYTIAEAVQSVLDQSYGNWELLVCDDASDDRTPEVMRGFTDPRIRYMQLLKSNGAGARNRGLRFARGEFITFLDSDNLWNPLFLDVMLRALMGAPGRAIAYCDYLDTEIRGARVTLEQLSRPRFRPVSLSNRNFIDLNTVFCHRRVYDWLGGFDEALPRLQDWDLMLRYTGAFPPLHVSHALTFYRRNVGWGQVTHLFSSGTTRTTVQEKTEARCSTDHERLAIDWPERGRVALVSGPGADAGPVAAALARLALRDCDVELIRLGPPVAGLPEGVRELVLPAPAGGGIRGAALGEGGRIAHALHDRLAGVPVIGIGLSARQLQAFLPAGTGPVHVLGSGAHGPELVCAGDTAIRFPLGALPLWEVEVPEGPAAGLPKVLVLSDAETHPRVMDGLERVLRSLGDSAPMRVVLPPPDFLGDVWHEIGPEGVRPLAHGLEEACAMLLPEVRGAVLATPLSGLTPFAFSLLAGLQGRGLPVGIRHTDAEERGLAEDWLASRAVYEIRNDDPRWIVPKFGRLLGLESDLAQMTARGRRAHQVANHPELVQERLAHFLYCVLFAPPRVGIKRREG